MAETAPLDPQTILRRRRQAIPRGPLEPLRERVGGLGQADDRLEKLLEELLYLAERETIFTMTLERDRLLSALFHSGYVGEVYLNIEHLMLPGVTQTTYLPVPPGFVICPIDYELYSSLPWWLTVYVWVDTDFPAVPYVFLTRAPESYGPVHTGGIMAFRRFVRYTTTNNHAVNTANFLAIQLFDFMTVDTWKMIEEVYLKPIVEFVQETAEKRTGRPFP